MLLALDIGNTHIVLGIFKGKKLVHHWRISTHTDKTSDEYKVLVKGLLSNANFNPQNIESAVLCSVVPSLKPVFEEVCQSLFSISPLIVRMGVKCGLKIKYDYPQEIGPDRIADATAAYHLYGGPVIIVDFGTALTFDVISEKGEYLGGAIAPGLEISARALFEHTALLPRVELAKPSSTLGKNTIAGIQSGIVYGFVELTQGMIKRLSQKLSSKPTVVATGGWLSLLADEVRSIDKTNPHLTLEGLRLIWKMNRK